MFDWLVNFLLYLPRKIFGWLLDAILYMLNNLPFTSYITSFFNTITDTWNSFPPFVHFLFDICAFADGMKMIMIALAIRFIIKIIPTVG